MKNTSRSLIKQAPSFSLQWKPRYSGPVVWVSIPKLDRSWKHGVYYVGKYARGNETASRSKYERFGEFVRKGQPVEMPHIAIGDGHVSFTDGRHRFAWLRDHGARAIPVTVWPEILAEVTRRFGTKSRTSRVRP
jgi:hypothetical protein